VRQFLDAPDCAGPNNPTVTAYDVGGAATVMGNGTSASAKRFILGILHRGGVGYFRSVMLDTMVSK
jgi:hypothetical protein